MEMLYLDEDYKTLRREMLYLDEDYKTLHREITNTSFPQSHTAHTNHRGQIDILTALQQTVEA